MRIDIRDGVLDLEAAQVLRVDGAAGTTILCEAGMLWVTQEGLVRDDFLRAGESLRVESAGATVVEVVGGLAASVRLRAPAAPSRVWTISPRRAAP